MDLNSINANINRLLTNIWAVISFLKEFAVDGAKDVSITYINADGSESVKTFPNIAKQIDGLESWKLNFITNTYRMDFRASRQGNILKIKATPYAASATVYELAKIRSQEDWSFNQIFIKIRRYSHSPTSETIYRLDNYYTDCVLTLEKDGGCNILSLTDNGIVGTASNGKDIYEWVLSASLPDYTGFDIDMEFVQSLQITDYRAPLTSSERGIELLSSLRVNE